MKILVCEQKSLHTFWTWDQTQNRLNESQMLYPGTAKSPLYLLCFCLDFLYSYLCQRKVVLAACAQNFDEESWVLNI
jgi:hypothetical protein